MKECKVCEKKLPDDSFEKNRRVCRKCKTTQNNARHTLTCVICKNLFTSGYKHTRFCSKQCQAVPLEKKLEVECPNCFKKHSVIQSRFAKSVRNYCSYPCRYSHMKITMLGENHPNYNRVLQKCSGCSCDMLVIPYYAEKDALKFCSYECYKTHIGEYFKGENSPHWNAKLTDEERFRNRNLPEYRSWRKSVYERDGFTCVVCGDGKGGNLNAHHLNSWSTAVKDRMSVSNGVTLCETCHVDFHKIYGFGNNTRSQFEYYLISKTKEP